MKKFISILHRYFLPSPTSFGAVSDSSGPVPGARRKIRTALFCLGVLVSANAVIHGQEFTHTTTASNIIASRSTLSAPGLANNPNAIIVATPTAETARGNPHPIGAWYYNGKWNIFNTDHANLAPGLVFKVQVFPEPGPNQFLHVVTRDNVSEGSSYIDNRAINNNPNVQLIILQNHSPDNRAYLLECERSAGNLQHRVGQVVYREPQRQDPISEHGVQRRRCWQRSAGRFR